MLELATACHHYVTPLATAGEVFIIFLGISILIAVFCWGVKYTEK